MWKKRVSYCSGNFMIQLCVPVQCFAKIFPWGGLWKWWPNQADYGWCGMYFEGQHKGSWWVVVGIFIPLVGIMGSWLSILGISMNQRVEEDRAEVLAVVAVFLCFWFWAFPTWDKMGPPQTAASVTDTLSYYLFLDLLVNMVTHTTLTRWDSAWRQGRDKIKYHTVHTSYILRLPLREVQICCVQTGNAVNAVGFRICRSAKG